MTVSQAKCIGVGIIKLFSMKVYQLATKYYPKQSVFHWRQHISTSCSTLANSSKFNVPVSYKHATNIRQQFKVQCSCFTYYINMQWVTLYDISIYRHARYLIVYVYNIIIHYSISTFRISFEQILASQNWFIMTHLTG